MKIKSSLIVLAASFTAHVAIAQTAAPAEPVSTVSFNAGAVTDYRFRGLTQTAFDGAIQLGVDYAHKSGAYVGAWTSNVSWVKDFNLATKGDMELDLYGGYKSELGAGLSYDVGAIRYLYPENNSGEIGTPGAGAYSNANTTEVYGAISYGVATFKYSQSVGDFLGNINSNGSRYFDLTLNFDLGKGYTISPHVGRQTVPNQTTATAAPVVGAAADYSDVSLTLSKDLGNGLVLSGTSVATNVNQDFYVDSKGKILGKSTVLIGLKYTF